MSNALPPTNTFCIAFDARGQKGYLKATKVTIETDMLPADDTEHRIDLADHPLYKQLQQYVLANPR